MNINKKLIEDKEIARYNLSNKKMRNKETLYGFP